MNVSDPSLPNYVRQEAREVREDLDLMADLIAGTRRMWEHSQTKKYIRKWKDEASEVYDIRRQCETVFEGVGRVLSAAVGMLFMKPPVMTWNQSEAAMGQQYANLDAQGTHGAVLCKRFADQAVRDGIGLILVDHPPAPNGIQVTAANEVALGLRPTWALYHRAQAISWRTEILNNARTLTQIVLEESTATVEGAYGVKPVKHYRILRLIPTVDQAGKPTLGLDGLPDNKRAAVWELWEETKEQGMAGFKRIGAGTFLNRAGQMRDTLPLRVAYTGRTDALMTSTIPLLGVAWGNLAHWRLSTELCFGRMVAAIEQPAVIGELIPTIGANGMSVPGKIKLGWMTAIQIQTGGDFKWVGPSGKGLAELTLGVEEKLEQMAAQGASFLRKVVRGVETAEAKRLDATAENSTLATAGQGIEDAWNGALEDHAWYLGIEKAGAPVITINKDFDSIALDPPTMAAYVSAVKDAGLPPRILLEAWQQGGRIPADVDLDALEAEMMANAAAQAQQQADAQSAALALGGPPDPMRNG